MNIKFLKEIGWRPLGRGEGKGVYTYNNTQLIFIIFVFLKECNLKPHLTPIFKTLKQESSVKWSGLNKSTPARISVPLPEALHDHVLLDHEDF